MTDTANTLTALANIENEMRNTGNGFAAVLATLDNPAAIEQMGFKRMKPTRLFDDSNPTFSYPGGTSIADATVTHTFNFQSAFPDAETELFFMWGCAAQVHSNGDEDEPRAHAAVTLSDGTMLTNQISFGVHMTGTATTYVDGVLTASGETTKPAGNTHVTLQQRCYMDLGASANFMRLDAADILIWEYVK